MVSVFLVVLDLRCSAVEIIGVPKNTHSIVLPLLSARIKTATVSSFVSSAQIQSGNGRFFLLSASTEAGNRRTLLHDLDDDRCRLTPDRHYLFLFTRQSRLGLMRSPHVSSTGTAVGTRVRGAQYLRHRRCATLVGPWSSKPALIHLPGDRLPCALARSTMFHVYTPTT